MNPQEKAKDLLNRFYNTSHHSNSAEIRRGLAKQNAILCVDEILEQFPEMKIIKDCNYQWSYSPHPSHDFWSQVKDALMNQGTTDERSVARKD